jgi:hypothetical protein
MRQLSGARTPEELETLLEDALMTRDRVGLAALFETGSTLAAGTDWLARGGEESARRALALWDAGRPYLADPQHVVVARDLALVVGERGANVVRRDREGVWRFAIVWQLAGGETELGKEPQ